MHPQIHSDFTPRLDALLAPFAPALGGDRDGYRNHLCRQLNFYAALSGGAPPGETLLIAAAFHDIAIWSDATFDYLEPSARRAEAYLAERDLGKHAAEVRALIVEHHKLRPYRGPFEASVEAYRRADLIDVSLGLVRFGLPWAFIRAVQARFPDRGFHWRLLTLTGRQLLRTPLRPLPMLRW